MDIEPGAGDLEKILERLEPDRLLCNFRELTVVAASPR